MNQSTHKPGIATRIMRRWYQFLRSILHIWVRTTVLPDADGNSGVSGHQTICYVIDDYALSSVLILDKACQNLNIHCPLKSLTCRELNESRSYAALKRKRGMLIRRPSVRRHSEFLGRLVEHSYQHRDKDILLVPVTVLVGRAPDKQTGLAKTLFAEDWEVAGRFRRFFATLFNGRDTVVQFSRPISLRDLAAEELGAPRSLRKVSRVLRMHFRRVKSAMIGPDLSHRRTMVSSVIGSASVRQAIAEKVRRDKISEDKATRIVRKYALEISANYSHNFIRIFFFLVKWLTQKMFSGLTLENFEQFKPQTLDHEVIYLPCHRSHVDYLLLSYLLYTQGIVPPHIAAGVNLNLPVVGSWLRRGGAFYLRRTFRSQKLYSAVFSEYVSLILSRGVSIEYFIEGTRSRTGRLLPPKGGMLAITVRSYLRAPVRPLMFQPVYIGYEQLAEGSSYTSELSGKAKKSESLLGLFKAFKVLRKNYGKAHVRFGEPIFLDNRLERYDPQWRKTTSNVESKPAWLTPLVNELGEDVLRGINQCADANPVNLLAMVLLATPKHSMGEQELLGQLELYQSILSQGPSRKTITVTALTGAEIIDYGFSLELLERKEHRLGDIISLAGKVAVGLTYFRNNVAHLFAIPSLVACSFLRHRQVSIGQLQGMAGHIYPFLKAELFLPWTQKEFSGVLETVIQQLESHELLTRSDDGQTLTRAGGGRPQAWQLTVLARGLLQTLERYFITLAVLEKNGSGSLSRAELERLCFLTAQRISRVHEFESPEFYDRSLFRQFIAQLRRSGILVNNEAGKLEFGEQLSRIGDDARLILEKEIRHGITRVAPQVLESEQHPDN